MLLHHFCFQTCQQHLQPPCHMFTYGTHPWTFWEQEFVCLKTKWHWWKTVTFLAHWFGKIIFTKRVSAVNFYSMTINENFHVQVSLSTWMLQMWAPVCNSGLQSSVVQTRIIKHLDLHFFYNMLNHMLSVVTELENWNECQDYSECLVVVSNYKKTQTIT